MRKTAGHVSAVLRRLILIGCSIQIVLGLCWMFCALSNTLSSGKGGWEGVVCVPVILITGWVLWFFLGALRKGKPFCRAFCVAAVLSFPMILPFLLAPDVRLLTTLLLLLQWGCLIRSIGRVQSGCLDRQGFWWFLAGFFCWMAAGIISEISLAVGMVPLLVFLFRLRGRHSVRLLFAVLAMAGIVTAAGQFFRPAEPLVHLADRIAWSSLYAEYDRLPLDDRKALKYEVMVEGTYETDGVEKVLVPALTERRGKEGMEKVLKHMIANAWEFQRTKVCKEILWDFAGYVLAPPVFLMQVQGRAYDSFSGLNYRNLLLPAPVLGSYYMRYGCFWFLTGLILRCCMLAADRIRGKHFFKEDSEEKRFAVICFPGILFVQAFLYTMSGAGKMDYRSCCLILMIWLAFLAGGCEEGSYGDA